MKTPPLPPRVDPPEKRVDAPAMRTGAPVKRTGVPAKRANAESQSADADGEPVRQVEDPTPEQIAERSAEIRLRWSERVKKKRHLTAPVQWSVPQVPIAEIDNRPPN